MDRAINKETGKIVSAFEIFKNASYQEPRNDKWVAPEDSIKNWDDLLVRGITEIPVTYVKESVPYTNWRGTEIISSPHFKVFSNSPGKTIPESPLHKALKNWLFNHMKKDDLVLWYSKESGKQINEIKLSEIENIDWNRYNIEITSTGYRRVRADVLIPFKKKDALLGWGLDFEIQLIEEVDERKEIRTMQRILNGYSVVWLNKKDFHYNENFTEVELKNTNVKFCPFAVWIVKGIEGIKKDFIRTIVEQGRLIDEKVDTLKDIVNNEIRNAMDSIDTGSLLSRIEKKVEKDYGPSILFYLTHKSCPSCGSGLREIRGRDGPFLGCTGYPGCRYTQNIPDRIKDSVRNLWSK